MPADPETVAAIISHLDARLERQDEKRSAEFAHVYQKIDDHAERADASLKAFAKETTSAFKDVAVQVAKIETTLAGHISTATAQFNGIGAEKRESSARVDGWAKTFVGSALGGGSIWAFLEWWRTGGKP